MMKCKHDVVLSVPGRRLEALSSVEKLAPSPLSLHYPAEQILCSRLSWFPLH